MIRIRKKRKPKPGEAPSDIELCRQIIYLAKRLTEMGFGHVEFTTIPTRPGEGDSEDEDDCGEDWQ